MARGGGRRWVQQDALCPPCVSASNIGLNLTPPTNHGGPPGRLPCGGWGWPSPCTPSLAATTIRALHDNSRSIPSHPTYFFSSKHAFWQCAAPESSSSCQKKNKARSRGGTPQAKILDINIWTSRKILQCVVIKRHMLIPSQVLNHAKN